MMSRDNPYPFNPEEISIEKKDMLVELCVRRMRQGTIVLNPDFQRNEVWSDVKKSRLIESLMLRIPIQIFYVSSDTRENFTVVDGLQRLTAFRDFILGRDFKEAGADIGNGMKLVGLEYLTEYEGMTFNQLPIFMQNRITETVLTFTIINPRTPKEVMFNIFKRINTGGLQLMAQEMRNALYTGRSTKILRNLAHSNEFVNATSESISNVRMVDMELVLRCLSFIIRDYSDYPKNGDMPKFLEVTMQILNSHPGYDSEDIRRSIESGFLKKDGYRKLEEEEIETLIKKGMVRSFELFGRHCFRTSFGEKKRKSINRSLLEMWGSELCRLTEDEFKALFANKDKMMQEYVCLLEDPMFLDKISRHFDAFKSVQYRFSEIRQLINKYKF